MHGLSLTYQTLAQSRNAAAVDVLLAALESSKASLVTKAITALVQRQEPQAAAEVLERWEKLSKKDVAIVRGASPWMDVIVPETLKRGTGNVFAAIEAARALQLASAIEPMILLAESSGSRAIRQQATDAVMELVVPLGRAARQENSMPSVRNSIMSRLADSVRRFSMHRNETLVDAFLCITTGGDGDIRQMIAEQGPEFDLICKHFRSSDHPAVIDLLASYIRRRNPDPRIIKLMQDRSDAVFRDMLLDKIGANLSAGVSRNLRDFGIPKSCASGARLMPEIDPSRRAALVHMHIGAGSDTITTMQTIAAAIKFGGPGCETAAANGLSSCKVLDIDFWMRAAVPVAENDVEEIACDENAALLQDLIDLLDHRDAAIVDGVRHVLSPMHAAAMLPRMAQLRARSRRRIGRVVMMIDANAIERVRDALRHPVLERRLEAIAMADSLALVDLLSESFSHISKDDHQQARICAAEAMGEATGNETMHLLESMVRMPISPVRDAAELALQRRQKQSQKKVTAGRRP